MYDTEGDCVKKWDWPPNHGKLATSIIFAVSIILCIIQTALFILCALIVPTIYGNIPTTCHKLS